MKLSLPRRISTGLREIINYLGGMRFTKLSQPAASLLVIRSWRTAKDTRPHQGKSAAKNLAQLWTDGKDRGGIGRQKRRVGKLKTLILSKHWLWEYTLCTYIAYNITMLVSKAYRGSHRINGRKFLKKDKLAATRSLCWGAAPVKGG